MVDAFAANFSFDAGAPPDCTNDYVVFGLQSVGGIGAAANLVAFNNLYSGTSPTGPCGAAPKVLFAYNTTTVTGGRITTSPILSLHAEKIGFVDSVPGSTPPTPTLHVSPCN